MNETAVRQQVFHAASLAHEWPITQTNTTVCPRCHTQIRPPIGRPDILIVRSAIEVKVVGAKDTSFAFSEINEDQREWQDKFLRDGKLGYIALGVIRQHGKVQKLDHLYMVPWAAWLETEDKIRPYQASIPVEATKGMRKELQEQHLDILTLLAPYEMERSNGVYEIRWAEPLAVIAQEDEHERSD